MATQAKVATYLVSPYLKKGRSPKVKKLYEDLANINKDKPTDPASVRDQLRSMLSPQTGREKVKSMWDNRYALAKQIAERQKAKANGRNR